jgi:hypothetical protein
MSVTTNISFHSHDPDDEATATFETGASGRTWLDITVGDADVAIFVTRDQAVAIGKAIMDQTDAWAKV